MRASATKAQVIEYLFQELRDRSQAYFALRREHQRVKTEIEFRQKMMTLLGEQIQLWETGRWYASALAAKESARKMGPDDER